jgi:hypothetical protein
VNNPTRKEIPYLYTIGYDSYEEGNTEYLWHKEKISARRLKSLVHEAAVAVLKERLNNEDYDSVHNYQDIHNEVIAWLVDNRGFMQVAVQQDWGCFGWPSIFVLDDWKGDRDKYLNALTRAVGAAGFNETHDSSLDRWSEEIIGAHGFAEKYDFHKPHCCICNSNDKLRAVRRFKYTMPDGTEIWRLPEWLCLKCRKLFEGKFKYTKTKPY